MCNLFQNRCSADEIAAHFGIEPTQGPDVPDETIPQGGGLVVRETGNRRVLQSLSWGFPRLTAEMRASGAQPTPVNLVANLTSPMWSQLVSDPRYRCLVPMTHFAEPDGRPGSKTRTWYSVRDRPVVAWAGFCRRTPDWGSVFACMTTDSNSAVEPLNPRMPVLLEPADYDRWLHGDIRDVIDFQFRAFPSDRLQIERSDDLWVRREKKAEPQMALQL